MVDEAANLVRYKGVSINNKGIVNVTLITKCALLKAKIVIISGIANSVPDIHARRLDLEAQVLFLIMVRNNITYPYPDQETDCCTQRGRQHSRPGRRSPLTSSH